MANDSLSIDRIVEILVDLDVVAFDEPGPWPGPPGPGDQVCEVDHDAIWPSDRGDAPVGHARSEASDEYDPWGQIEARLRELASRGPYDPPPILDALAWYLPLHFFGNESAIYIRESALIEVVHMILGDVRESRRFAPDVIQGACRSAYSVLYLHEAFHHKVESFAIRSEVIEQAKRYVPYTHKISSPLLKQGSDDVLEEALACAEMFRRLGEPTYKRGVPADVRRATKAFLQTFIPSLGPSYRRGGEFFGNSFQAGLHTLFGQIQEAEVAPLRDPRQWETSPNLHRGILNIKTHTRVLVPMGEEPLIPWFTPSFRGTISSRSARKLLTKRFDYREIAGAGKGNHIRLKSPTLPSQTLPANRESLSPGVVKSVASGVGLHPQELIDFGRRV